MPQSAYNASPTDNVPHRKAAQQAFGSSFTMCFESPKGFACPLFNLQILFLLVYIVMVVFLAVFIEWHPAFTAFYTTNMFVLTIFSVLSFSNLFKRYFWILVYGDGVLSNKILTIQWFCLWPVLPVNKGIGYPSVTWHQAWPGWCSNTHHHHGYRNIRLCFCLFVFKSSICIP